jgi:hypothetical protein
LSATRGFFPRAEILAFLDGTGRPIAANGTTDMPIWGPLFMHLDPSNPRVKVRLQNVVDYLASLQQPKP